VNAKEWDREYLWHFRASLIRVHDADTIVVLTDNGMDGRHKTNIRIADLWEPEIWTEDGKARANALMLALQNFLPPPQSEWNLRVITRQLKTKVEEDTSFTRYVGDVWLVPAGGEMIDLKAANPQVKAALLRGITR